MRNRLFNYNVAFRTSFNKLVDVLKRIYYVNAPSWAKSKTYSPKESVCFADYKEVFISLYMVTKYAFLIILTSYVLLLPISGKKKTLCEDRARTSQFLSQQVAPSQSQEKPYRSLIDFRCGRSGPIPRPHELSD